MQLTVHSFLASESAYFRFVACRSCAERRGYELLCRDPSEVSSYITYAGKIFNELSKDTMVIKATGNALPKAVQVAEVIKRRFKGLHQVACDPLLTQRVGCFLSVEAAVPVVSAF